MKAKTLTDEQVRSYLLKSIKQGKRKLQAKWTMEEPLVLPAQFGLNMEKNLKKEKITGLDRILLKGIKRHMKKKKFLANEYQKGSTYDFRKVEHAFEEVLDSMNFDWEHDPNMKGTPNRLARMYMEELFVGCYLPEPRFTTFPNTKKYDEMILLKDIRIVSTCSHHVQPFTGICHIGYLPSPTGLICGASKLARIAHWFALRPQIQEELTTQIAEYLMKKLSPLGVIVIIEAQHGCMTNRGVKEYNSKMVTSKVLGVFKTKPAARAEAMSLIKG